MVLVSRVACLGGKLAESSVYKPPHAFVTYDHDDWDRFVGRLAAALRTNGTELWVDRWEMKPGVLMADLVAKDGVGKADFILAVISKHSVKSNWVQYELGLATNKQIGEGATVICILLDGEDPPLSQAGRKYVRFRDLDDSSSKYLEKFAELDDAIHGREPAGKPPVGRPRDWSMDAIISPPAARSISAVYGGVTIRVDGDRYQEEERTEQFVFDLTCELAYRDRSSQIMRDALVERAERDGVIVGQVDRALNVLIHEDRLRGERYNGPEWLILKVDPRDVDEWATQHIEGYLARRQRLIADLAEQGESITVDGLFRTVDHVKANEPLSVETMLAALKEEGEIQYAHSIGRDLMPILTGVSPVIQRRQGSQLATTAIAYAVTAGPQRPTAADYPEMQAIKQHMDQTDMPVVGWFADPSDARAMPFSEREVFEAALNEAVKKNGLLVIQTSTNVATTAVGYLELVRIASERNVGVLPVEIDPGFTIVRRAGQ